MDDGTPQKLRRTWLSGYRVADVQILLAQLRLRASQLEHDLAATRERLEETEEQRRELTRLLEEGRSREAELAAVATAAEAERRRAAEDARSRAEQIVEAARLDAARVRADAALEAERARAQVEELLRLRESLAATMRLLIREFERVMSGELETAPATTAPLPGRPTAVPPPADVFDRVVEIEAGPFADPAALTAFERALESVPRVEQVYVRRVDGDRATIEVTLDEPAPLLAEMTQRLPYHLDVDRAEGNRIELRVSGRVA